MQKINLTQQKLKYYIAASYLINTPARFKKYLFEFLDSDIVKFWHVNKTDLVNFSCEYPDITIPKNFLEQKSEINPDKVLEKIENSKINFFTVEDDIYPKLLRGIEDYPLILYYKGVLDEEIFENMLAVVGSRKASEEAKTNLSRIISEMKNSNVTIVSGLAAGLDGIAHESALKNKLRTIGVIASGHNFKYPSTNRALYEEIVEKNLILSEFPPEIPPVNYYFPQRNRIVTGLSKGTLVAEAALKSGAMISANLALEQGRELMCIPGSILNKNTEGIYKLLKAGAAIVTNGRDVFENLGWELKSTEVNIETTEDEAKILKILALESKSLEQITESANLAPSILMVLLTALELKGLIKQTRGKYYITG